MAHLTLARALAARIARRFVRFATIGAVVIFLIIAIIIAALATLLSGWWWLVLIPFALVFLIFLILRLIVVLIIRRLYPAPLSSLQEPALDGFIDKIQALLEARATPLPIIILVSIKDLLLHRDITTIRGVIRDSASLSSDYRDLEQLFR